jgi:hypothetical protein
MLRSASLFLLAAFALQAIAQQPAAAVVPSQGATSLVGPALNVLAKAGSAVDLNKWKGSNGMREEVDGNLLSIQKDIQTTLPPLLSTADAAPDSAAASLPVLLNLDALYSVVLRITIASRAGAPRDQNTQLEQAAITLDNARRDLGDRITATVIANEKKVATLQATVQQQTAALKAAQPPPPPPPPPPVKVTPKKRKPAPKPTAPATGATPAAKPPAATPVPPKQ